MEVFLKDLTEKITKGTTPSNIGASFTDEGIMYFRSELVGKGKYIDKTSGLLFISQETHGKLKRSQLKVSDILFSMAGVYLGKVSIVGDDDVPANTNQAVAIIRFKKNVCNIDYIYYYMKQRWFNEYVRSFSSQAAQPNINLEQIGKLKINLPDRMVQNKIVKTVSFFDELIEKNNRRIKILEQMAENLYKEWFVRFRFPGYETAEFVDGVPKGWEYQKLKSLLEIFYGKDHKKIADGDIPIFGSGGIMRYGNKSLHDGEVILIPRKGTLNNIMYYSGKVWTVDTMFYAVSQIPNTAKYIYYTLNNFDMESYNSGAALPSMTTAILYNLKILLPDEKTLEKYDSFVGKLFEEKECLEKQNQNLIKQRDYLLPRLMSGKLQVK